MRNFVCVDVDGVLLNLNDTLRHILSEKGKDFKYENQTVYSYGGDIGVVPEEDIYPLFQELTTYVTELYFPYEGAFHAVEKLLEICEVQMYSCLVSDNPSLAELRNSFAKMLHMTGSVYTHLDSSFGRKPVIKEAKAVFEDCFAICKEWVKAGFEGYVFLISQPYNRQIYNEPESSVWEKIIVCEDFADAVDKYISLCEKE